MNEGIPNTAFSTVASYVSGSISHTLTDITDGLVSGKIYTFRWYAVNAFGTGEISDEISIAVTD